MTAVPGPPIPTEPEPGPLASATRWLARRRTAVLLAIVIASTAERVVYFAQLQAGPLLWQHLWNQTDMHYYDAWARDIAGGDWLSRRVGPPQHFWHQKIAMDYFRLYPADPLAPPPNAPMDPARISALWSRWCGGGRFYQDPLYPYLLGLTYRVSGADVRHVFVWQMAAGVLANVLLWLLARHCFGDLVAAVAALLGLLYAPLLFYEMVLLRDSLVVFAGLALAWLAARQLAGGRSAGWLGLGAALGVALLLKAHFVVFLAGLLSVLVLRARGRLAGWARPVALVVLGTALGLLPVMARNAALRLPVLGLATNGTVTFVLANAEDAGTVDWGLGHTAAILGASNNRLLPAAVLTLRTHAGVWSYARLLAARFAAAWYWFETPNNENFYYYRLHAGVLRALPLTFAAVGPLAAAGLVLAVPAWRRCLALYLLVLTDLAALVMTFVLSRYRVALAAALLPFAALALVRLMEWMVARRWGRAAAAAVVIAVLALAMGAPRPAGTTRVRVSDVLAAYRDYYIPRIREADEKSDYARAAAVFRESLAHEPPEVRRLGPSRPARGAGEISLCQVLSRIHAGYAERLRAAGDAEAAAREERRSQELTQALGPATGPGPGESATIAPRPQKGNPVP